MTTIVSFFATLAIFAMFYIIGIIIGETYYIGFIIGIIAAATCDIFNGVYDTFK